MVYEKTRCRETRVKNITKSLLSDTGKKCPFQTSNNTDIV